MVAIYEVWQWLLTIFGNATMLVEWLVTPLHIGSLVVTPLGLLSISGLLAFIPIAVAKWIIS